MSFKTITLASIYELQGFKDEAIQIYEEILKENPENKEAKEGIKRLKKELPKRKKFSNINKNMLNFFIQADNQEELKTFERWLMEWN